MVEPGRAIGRGGGDGLGGADALQGGVGADAVGEVQHRLVGRVAAFFDDVGGAELQGELLAVGVAAEGDDPLGAQPLGGQDGGQADRPVADDRHGVAGLDAGAHRGVMAGGHDIRQGQQRLERLVGMARAGDRDQGAAGERDAHRLALAAVDHAVAEVPAPHAADGGAVQAVRAGHVAEDERGDHQITGRDPVYLGASSLRRRR